ncbi:ubiquitin thioesterase OTU1-like [Glandiceps talaboti]
MESNKQLLLRCQSKHGRYTVEGLTLNSTVSSLMQKIYALTGIPSQSQVILYGYPLKSLNLSNKNALLRTLPFRSGDTMIVEENPSAGPAKRVNRVKSPSMEGRLRRLPVPADNSCLFSSISFLIENGQPSSDTVEQLRELIARTVSKNPNIYTSAFLGRDNAEYCAWIMSKEAWGGAIEIAILSEFYGVEIDVIDIQSAHINRFGESKSYKNRLLVIYDGVHYDPLVLETGDPDNPIQTTFPTTDDVVLAEALSLAEEARQMKHYTDLERFKLRCIDCNIGLTGYGEAEYHASKTGHTNFGEVEV